MKTVLRTPSILKPLALVLGVTASVSVFADPLIEREKTLRFPDSVRRNATYAEIDPDPDFRHASPAAYAAFRAMKYGVRIHWGLYSNYPDSRESWNFLLMNYQERQKYIDLYKTWNPVGFNADEWMQFFQRAGFNTFAITTKHHEGFSLWDTKTRVVRRANYLAPGGLKIEECDVAYSVMETPFKRDIIKELTDAARNYPIKINLYFSHTDFYDADFRPYGRHPLQWAESPGLKGLQDRQPYPIEFVEPVGKEERERMIARHRAQLRELLTNYGKIDMVCFDINFSAEVWPGLKQTVKELRALQPDVMFRNRGIGNYGDYYTPERVVPSDNSESVMPWMVIYPLGSHFSYDADPATHKGPKWVIDNLVDSVSKGGNFMVGIGPDANGKFHPTAIAQLEEVGRWLKAYGECIFGTHNLPGERYKDGETVRITASDDNKHVYAIALERPKGKVTLTHVSAAPDSKVYLLGHSAPLTWRAAGEGMEIDFPADAKDSLAYPIKIVAAAKPAAH
jgi:alpha-L-fucosidase